MMTIDISSSSKRTTLKVKAAILAALQKAGAPFSSAGAAR
jgi:hypothetical protein